MLDGIKNLHCATCKISLSPGSAAATQVFMVELDYVREWPYPANGNAFTQMANLRATTVLCTDCLEKPVTHAVEFQTGEMILHPVANLRPYRKTREYYLPDHLDQLTTYDQVEEVFDELWQAGHRGDQTAGAFLADWLLDQLCSLVPRPGPHSVEVIGLAIRQVFFEHQPVHRIIEILSTTVHFEKPAFQWN